MRAQAYALHPMPDMQRPKGATTSTLFLQLSGFRDAQSRGK